MGLYDRDYMRKERKLADDFGFTFSLALFYVSHF